MTLVVVLMFCDEMGSRMPDRSSLPANRQVKMAGAHL